jgi:hypothetical protein
MEERNEKKLIKHEEKCVVGLGEKVGKRRKMQRKEE